MTLPRHYFAHRFAIGTLWTALCIALLLPGTAMANLNGTLLLSSAHATERHG